jgi:hypothetical protein
MIIVARWSGSHDRAIAAAYPNTYFGYEPISMNHLLKFFVASTVLLCSCAKPAPKISATPADSLTTTVSAVTESAVNPVNDSVAEVGESMDGRCVW